MAMENPTIVLGIELMDRDHLRLESMFEAVAQASDEDLPGLRREIATELAAHFAREEEFMRERQFPGLHCHVAQHNVLKAELAQDLDQSCESAMLRRRWAVVLPQLILSHVATMDRMIVAFLNGELGEASFDTLRLPMQEPAA
jgi:hemerythrin-like metal-binding protein